MVKIEAPIYCPACDSTLQFKNDVLYCLNMECEARTQKSLEHWAKTLKIKGLGPQTITKLNLTSIQDIYSLTEGSLVLALGLKTAIKLLQEIENSKLAPLDLVLPAFGIPLIGRSATEKLKSILDSLDALTAEKAKQAGLGPKAIENLMLWYTTKYIPEYKLTLPINYRFANSNVSKEKEVSGVVCITGKLYSFKTKAEAESALVDAGFTVSASITKNVTHLVNESGIESAKTQKARESGVTIITNITQLLGVNYG